jgi:membrane protease YdiL (CAAX protease family)
MPRPDDETLAIAMGLSVVGLQFFALFVLMPLMYTYLPGFRNEHYVVMLSSVPLLVPVAVFYSRVGSFKARFKGLGTSLTWGLLFGCATVAISFAIYTAGEYLLGVWPGFNPFSLSKLSVFWIFVSVLYFPFVEEVLFRGYILHLLLENSSAVTAIVVAASLNTFVHIITYSITFNLALIFVFSVINGISYIKGGLGASLIAHMMNNMVVALVAGGP